MAHSKNTCGDVARVGVQDMAFVACPQSKSKSPEEDVQPLSNRRKEMIAIFKL